MLQKKKKLKLSSPLPPEAVIGRENQAHVGIKFRLAEEVSSSNFQTSSKSIPLLFLDPSILKAVGWFLSSNDAVKWAQASKNCANLVASQLKLQLLLENKILTEKNFLEYFGENQIYKEAQHLSLSGSSFHPAWLRHLPKSIKSIKLYKMNTHKFSQYGFKSPLEMKTEILRILAEVLPTLKSLDFSRNELQADGAQHIAQLSTLTHLDISENQIGDEGVKHLVKLRGLTNLDISENQIGEEGAHYVAQLSTLIHLNISDNHVGDEGVHRLSQLSTLTHLYIGNNQIQEKGAHHLSQLGALPHLDIHGNWIGDKGARYIAQLGALTFLDIEDSEIRSRGALDLRQLSALTFLDISKNEIEEEAQGELRRMLPSCVLIFR